METSAAGIVLGLLIAFASFPVAYFAARLFLNILMLAISPRN
jgi:hypothetical protein